ncbi:hypothetical protein PR048_004956 [Dryococelus australis]|uniref:DDE-1 domain-containing protein n=1 Tax=Dryococelus australis TaxID=614101 RepID=A0ABQ9I6W4_9NEOP|nr:hypothetical protein PR048_004956 [Dryococelus australis]
MKTPRAFKNRGIASLPVFYTHKKAWMNCNIFKRTAVLQSTKCRCKQRFLQALIAIENSPLSTLQLLQNIAVKYATYSVAEAWDNVTDQSLSHS